ncbi:sigma-70 family RNA polymerase sigma factor [Nocardioides sp.]|uniref:RNA polymerase sigma factor n=1 Tax=Nocardioides sp. TaxID=35761 RepID=UPI0026278DC8|nr:sigma-70 family RNA polymerase sigma factor [Nocardioides sp.]
MTARVPADVVAELLAQRGHELMRVAYVLAPAEAEDLLQGSLVRLLASPGIAEAENPFGYAKKTIVNEFLDSRRRRDRMLRIRRLVFADGEISVSEESRYSDRDALIRAFSGLRPRERACVVLRYYEGYEDAEIAEVLGVARSTVRSLIFRALPRLRRALQSSGFGDRQDGGRGK